MTIYGDTFSKYERIASSKLNTMVSAINAHNHSDSYYLEAEQLAMYDKVKASAGDGTSDYLDGKVDNSSIKVTTNQLTLGNLLGSWTNVGTSGTAETDGFVHVFWNSTSGLFGTSGGVTRTVNQGSAGGYGGISGITFPVRKGDAWSVTGGTVNFIPFGS